MSTHPASSTPASKTTADEDRDDIAWLLREFATDTTGVTHVVLLSRDGLRLLDSEVDRGWADSLAASVSGLASLAGGFTGPGGRRCPARQVLIERDDCLIFVRNAGRSSAFDNQPGGVDTILAVVAAVDSDAHTIGFSMGRLVGRLAPYMLR
ncbi:MULTISPECIES: roadblock/LC7 domain-containing protein [unclassified Streptomyces]|uniref:roadblock/LC7 domain-containing protein n=1 Tax=unclassified Streptomyces TaxID=2593676 RepID=UPI001F542490|nr:MULTISPECIES: roadblock/LC7 domain-containing protein [unclassified Streptomyces]